MKKKILAATAILIITIILTSGVIAYNYWFTKPENKNVYVGVAFCGNTIAEGKQLIDKVKGYTNLFVLQSGLLQRDFDSVNELGDYAVEAGMSFLPYFGNFIQDSFSSWLDSAKTRWGDKLLGVYYGDEPGGKMLDDYVQFRDIETGDSITKTRYGDVVVQKPNGVIINYQFDGAIRLSEPAPVNSNSDINSEKVFYPNGTVKVVNAAPNGFSYQTYKQLNDSRPFKNTEDIAHSFYEREKGTLEFLKNSTAVFTSDYALYWFDYQAGYDVVLGQVGWNVSVGPQLSLLRGAANMQAKDWGVFITWKYQSPPYLDTGKEILNQLTTAYECGAKYYVIFDYYEENSGPYGTMQEEHFQALKTFWREVVENSQIEWNTVKANVALVFPQNYGWGMRWAEDKIWGIFEADQKTRDLWNLTKAAADEYGLNMDIVYTDVELDASSRYQDLIYWNET